MADETIGGISIPITADYSGMRADFDAAQNVAQQAGTEIAGAFNGAADGAKHAETESEGLFETLLKFAGLEISVGVLREMVAQSIELANVVERSSIAIGALRNDVAGTTDRIAELEEVAQRFGVSFEALLPVEQRFAALGLSVEQSRLAMRAAIEAAAALNKSVEDTANTIDRLALSGVAGTRQLVALGLSVDDLAAAMGVTKDQVKDVFKELDQADRLKVLEEALQKFGGTAEKVADSFSGRWQKAKNEFNAVLADIGSAIEKAVTGWVIAFEWLADHTAANVAAMAREIPKLEEQAHNLGIAFPGLTKAFRDGDLSQREYLESLTRLIEKVKEHREGMVQQKETAAAVAEAMGRLGMLTEAGEKATRNFVPDLDAASKGMDFLSASAEAAAATQELLLLRLGMAQDELQRATITYNKASQSGVGYVEALVRLTENQEKYEKAAKAAGVSQEQLNKVMAEAPDVGPAKQTPEDKSALSNIEAIMQAARQSANILDPLIEAFKTLRLTIDSTSGDAESKMVAAFNVIANDGRSTLQQVEQSWGKVSGAVSRLASSDIPAAIHEQELYIAALERTNAPIQKILDADAQRLKNEIALAHEQGRSADSYMIQLAHINERTLILNATTNILGRTYTNLMNDVNHAFGAVAGNLSKLIVEGGKFGEVWHKIWTQFAEDILTTVIQALEQWVLKLILGNALAKASSSALDIGQVTGQAAIAGAAGFASVMAAVPFPFNIGLAPAIAATAAGSVLSTFVPMAAFEKGIDFVPEDMIAMIHKGERVTPAAQNRSGADASNGPVSVTIHVHADRNPRETARTLARHLKTLSPVFSPLGAG